MDCFHRHCVSVSGLGRARFVSAVRLRPELEKHWSESCDSCRTHREHMKSVRRRRAFMRTRRWPYSSTSLDWSPQTSFWNSCQPSDVSHAPWRHHSREQWRSVPDPRASGHQLSFCRHHVFCQTLQTSHLHIFTWTFTLQHTCRTRSTDCCHLKWTLHYSSPLSKTLNISIVGFSEICQF